MASSNLQFTRFENPFKTREGAISRLNTTSRTYAETVALKYFNAAQEECMMLALYRSSAKGDYYVLYDSDAEVLASMVSTIYEITKQSPEETDETSIKRALLGKTPNEKDYVCITSYDELSIVSYVYSDGKWYCLGKGTSSGGSVDVGDVLDIIDGETIVYNEITGTIGVSKIYGGTF